MTDCRFHPRKEFNMSASVEELLQQIYDLENQIRLDFESGKNTKYLREQLDSLKEQFHSMNENLKKSEKILKG